VSNQVEIIYSSHNSKETGEIIRISPRKSARGIRPLFKGLIPRALFPGEMRIISPVSFELRPLE
jgi:hypothetical protein